MSESAARITLSAKKLIMKIVGDILIIETSDPDELPPLLGGDLTPAFGFCFPLFSMVLPRKSANWVENPGRQ